MQDDFEFSRRKALAALGTVGVASAGAGLGTSAYFSDQETFENNQLTAGELDMKAAYRAYYSDWLPDEAGTPEGEGVAVRMWDGAANTTGTTADLEPEETGLPTNDAWLIAVDDPDQFLANTRYADEGTATCGPAGTDAEDIDRPVVDIEDVKPGDFGEVTFDFTLCDNPGFVRLDGTIEAAAENGLTEPEADDPQEDGLAGATSPAAVELLDVVRAAVWIDDGDNYQDRDEGTGETTEPVAITGSLRQVLTVLSGGGLALDGDITAEEGGGAAGARNCFSAQTVHSVAFAWWVPIDHGNEIQTDSVRFSLGLSTTQCRHNDGIPASVAGDLDVLNYALTLEHLEYAFYRDRANTDNGAAVSDAELESAVVAKGFGPTVAGQVPDYLDVITQHEGAHVTALENTITALGGTPVTEGTYDFGYTNATEFLDTAQTLEDTGVGAYTGAADSIANNSLLGTAAGIQSVEASHASFLRLVNVDNDDPTNPGAPTNESPFPNAIDAPLSFNEVINAAGGFIISFDSIDPYPDPDATLDRKVDDGLSDIEILNFALRLEHLENAFYRDRTNTDNGAAVSDAELESAVAANYGANELEGDAVDRIAEIGAHEQAHVNGLSQVITNLGGTPVSEESYDFGYTNAAEFLAVAQALENTGVSAYAGAAPSVANNDVFTAAVGIHATEARHASFLNELNLDLPFPDVIDDPRTPADVLAIAGQFIV